MTPRTATRGLRTRWLGTALFLVGLFCLDRAIGLVLGELLPRVKTGQSIGLVNAALDRRDADVIVFGNSRALHHIDPDELTAGTGCSGYNAGVNGQGILYQRMLESLLISRGTSARLFVLLAEPPALYLNREDRARNMTPFVDENETVRSIVGEITPFADIKLMSHAYRFNGVAVPILRNSLRPVPLQGSGFIPLRGGLRMAPDDEAPQGPGGRASMDVQPQLAAAIHDFIAQAREHGVQVALVQGPRLVRLEGEEAAQSALRRLAREESVPLIELVETEYPEFLNRDLYRDPSHLNATGAELLSRTLAERLRSGGLLPSSCS